MQGWDLLQLFENASSTTVIERSCAIGFSDRKRLGHAIDYIVDAGTCDTPQLRVWKHGATRPRPHVHREN